MPKLPVYYSDNDFAVIAAAAGDGETPNAYVKRVSLGHANGEWNPAGVMEIKAAVDQLRESVAATPPASASAQTDPDQLRQIQKLAVVVNAMAKVILEMQASQQVLLVNNQALTKSIEGALL